MRMYIAGPMTGYKNYNIESFKKAQGLLEGRGYKVYNPADESEKVGFPIFGEKLEKLLKHELAQLCTCDGIYLLHGWQDSAGAKRELLLALSLGLFVEVQGWGGMCTHQEGRR